jgi:uncharacterized protein YwgA
MRTRLLSKLSNSELLVLLLSWSSNGKIEGRTRLEKLVYLLKHRGGVAFTYKFVPYHYGPYSRELVEDLDQLKEFGLVDETMNTDEYGVIRYDYSLTSEGTQLAKEIEQRLGREGSRDVMKAYDEWKERRTFELIALAKFTMSEEK